MGAYFWELTVYRIYSRKLSREWWKIDFSGEKTFADCSLVSPKQNATCSNFAEKTFANSHKTSKFAKVFSLESFPLYGIGTALQVSTHVGGADVSCNIHNGIAISGDINTKNSSPEMVRLTLLLLLGYSTWLVHGQASVCPGVSGQPGCVCQHPDGVIDLTKIANNGGSPRYVLMKLKISWMYSAVGLWSV